MEEGEVEPTVSMRSHLELVEKPNMNLALLDEPESEELGTTLCVNHDNSEAYRFRAFCV